MNKLLIAIGFAAQFFSISAWAHNDGPRGVKILDWEKPHVARVTATPNAVDHSQFVGIRTHGDRQCASATSLSIDVLDEFAFDLDETVELTLEVDTERTSQEIVIEYDKNGGANSRKTITLDKSNGERWQRVSVELERARFAGRLSSSEKTNADIWITASMSFPPAVSLCDLWLSRSHETKTPRTNGALLLNIKDEHGAPVSARVGLYDETGRMPMPASDALNIASFSDVSKTILQTPKNAPTWPHKNRYIFYVDGSYHAELPAGEYEVIIARGPEYRFVRQTVIISESETTTLNAHMNRWINMPEKGWYSGDTHIHASRSSDHDSAVILTQAQAEGIHLANVLQMGNIASDHFWQHNWGQQAWLQDGPFFIVPGQEDPRTLRRGHTGHLNIARPVRNPDRYYLYHEVFEAIQSQGGLTGYLHLGTPKGSPFFYSSNRSGLALDLPYGLVDYVEQLIRSGDFQVWFDFLNLGFELPIAAGSDFPYESVLGLGRTYVQIEGELTAQKWFDGLRTGRTFVSNGPMLDLSVNGHGIGSHVNVQEGAEISVQASAQINPDIDQLARIELYWQGDLVASAISQEGSQSLSLSHKFKPSSGGWFVIKAQGKTERPAEFINVVAMSSPVYISVDADGHCKPASVPTLVSELREEMRSMTQAPVERQIELEQWETWAPRNDIWPKNKPLLEERIEEVDTFYDDVLVRAAKDECF